AVRERSTARVVAITGSVGKTSTKDILAALLRPHLELVAAEDGFNNEIGLPLTLCRLETSTQVAVTEMGMRGPGQIRALAEVARPDIALITAIAPVHLELLGSMKNVVRAKAELLEALSPGGIAVLPADAPELDAFVPASVEVRAALDPLRDRADGRRTVAILGEMAELGDEARRFHEEIGRAAEKVDVVIGVGPLARAYEPDAWAADAAEAVAVARELVRPGDAVLVKASRSVGLEVGAEALAGVIAP